MGRDYDYRTQEWLFNLSKNNKQSQISTREKIERWDRIHNRGGDRNAVAEQYNGWLENPKIARALLKSSKPILDLGAGIGIDTLHLVEEGYRVIACDFSEVALSKVKENIPEARTCKVDMEQSLPFSDEKFDFIVANKSIHYFSEERTKSLINEIHRILEPNGHFAFIVNSSKDENFGAGQGTQLENNFYEVRGTTKRFFDEQALDKFFDKDKWEFVYKFEGDEESSRMGAVSLSGAADRKIAWTCLVKKKDSLS